MFFSVFMEIVIPQVDYRPLGCNAVNLVHI
jgi:hypothetical protein